MTKRQAEKYTKELKGNLIGMLRKAEHRLSTPKVLEELKPGETVIIFNRLSEVLMELGL